MIEFNSIKRGRTREEKQLGAGVLRKERDGALEPRLVPLHELLEVKHMV